MKAVLQTKVSPAYDDIPEQFYHFPRTYLNEVKAAVGDWIVYYEPVDRPTTTGAGEGALHISPLHK